MTTTRSRINSAFAVPFLATSISAFAADPVAVDDLRSISINSSLTVNVLSNDFDEDGDNISVVDVSDGELGTTRINNDGSILYTPRANTSGIDTFSYTIQDNSEESATATATVTVNIVENSYSGLDISSNTLTFSQSFSSYCSNLRSLSDAEAGDIRRQMALRCDALELLAQENPDAAASALLQVAPEETLSMLRNSLDAGRGQSNVVSQRIAQIKVGGPAISFNGHNLLDGEHATGGAAGDDDTLWSPVGIFISAQVEQSERERSDLENGYDSDGGSLTMGLDYRLNANTVMGAALGVSNSSLTYIEDAGSFDTNTISAIVFGAWTFGTFSLESQLGFSDMSFESERNIRYSDGQSNVNLSLTAETEGTQYLFNTQGQWEWNKDALSLFPYLRVEAQQNVIEGYEEFGGGGYSIGIEDQNATQVTASTGVQGTYALKFNWGILIPTFEVSLLSEVQSDRDDAIGYFVFDTQGDNKFALQNDGGDSSFFQVGVGASAVMKRGVSSFIQYKQISGYQYFSAWQLQAGLRFEL